MSVWMCSAKHIGALARAIVEKTERDVTQEQFETVARRLEKANRDSIAARYGRGRVPEMCGRKRYKWKHWTDYPALSNAECVQLAHCYEYQSCETRRFHRSQACRDIHALVFDVAYDYPGTNQVPWGI